MDKKRLIEIILTALFAALMAVGAYIRIPLPPVPITLQTLFEELDEESGFLEAGARRIDITAKYRGTPVSFQELLERLLEDAQNLERILSDRDRELFEDILANTISKKIRSKIQNSRRWVEKMNRLMDSMQTSSGLKLSLRWKSRRAEKEEQLDTSALVELLQKAKAAGLDAAGIAFHVGSQTTSADPYLNALDIAREIFEEAAANGMQLRIMDIGGGFPIPEPKVRFNLKEMLNQINARLDEDFPGVEIWCEPGRFICGTAVNLITSVIGVTERGGQPWYFLDDGLYGTFSGVLFDQWDFKLISFKEGEQVAATFAGPSCDSLDIMFRGKMTVRQEEGDLILVPICGAYTSASATTFNGFSKANFVVWEDVKNQIAPAQAAE